MVHIITALLPTDSFLGLCHRITTEFSCDSSYSETLEAQVSYTQI